MLHCVLPTHAESYVHFPKHNKRVTLKLLTPPRRFGHWMKQKTLLMAKWRGKTEMGGKREKERSAVSKHGDRGGSWLGRLWSKTDVNRTHLIKQPMTASSGKAIVLPMNVTELDPTNSRYPSFNHTRSRFELTSVLAIITQFWRDTSYRDEVGRVGKWVNLICVGSTPFLTCLQQYFSVHYRISTISSSTLRREVHRGVRGMLRFISKS